MKRAIEFGMVLLVTVAAASGGAMASGPALIPSDPAGGMQFFLGNSAARQGYLGVDVRDIAPDQVNTMKLRDTRGAEIIMVDHDAPAGKCGLREHDVILQMNGQAVEGREQARKMLHDLAPGKALQLVISRDGQQMTINTQMSSQEEVERQAWEQHLSPADSTSGGDAGEVAQVGPGSRSSSSKSFIGSVLTAPAYTGAMLEKMTGQLAEYFGVPTGAGLLVRSVEPNSPAALAGMHAGDVIVKAASRSMSTLADWARALKSGKDKPLQVVVLRDKKEQTLMMSLDTKKRSSVEPTDTSRLGLSFKGK